MSHPLSPEGTPTADLNEIQQEYPLAVSGKVHVDGPVQVHLLPSRIGVSRSWSVTDTDTQPILGQDDRRRRCTLLAISTVGQVNAATGFYIGGREDVRSGLAAFWPVNIPLVLEHTEQIFVRTVSAVTPSTVLLTVIAENWAN